MKTLEKPLQAKRRAQNAWKVRFAAAALRFAAAGALSFWGRFWPAASRYFFRWAKTAGAGLSAVFAFVPFSVAEWLLYGGLAGFVVYTVRFVRRMKREKDMRRKMALSYGSSLLLAAGILCFLFMALFGILYGLPPLAQALGLSVEPRPAEDLADTARLLLEEANRAAALVSRDQQGAVDGGGFSVLAAALPQTCALLADEYPLFSAPWYMEPKWVAASPLMSYLNISGIYIPFTAEANVNRMTPDTHLPFTMCHEAAHRLGVAREDEANFVAFLACINSENIQYNYSGYLCAYVYALNALQSVDREEAGRLQE